MRRLTATALGLLLVLTTALPALAAAPQLDRSQRDTRRRHLTAGDFSRRIRPLLRMEEFSVEPAPGS